MHNLHDHIGPALRREKATYITVHGSRTELATITAAAERLGEVLAVCDIEPCTEPGADNCFWLGLVMAGNVSLHDLFTAYRTANAANN